MRPGFALALVGAVFSFVTLLLVLFVILGSITDASVLDHLYFLKVNFSNVSTDVIPSLDSLSSYEVSQIRKYKFFTVGLWNYCAWTDSSTVDFCTKRSNDYHFNLQDIVYKISKIWLTVNQPGDLQALTDTIIKASKAMTSFYIIAIVTTFSAFLSGLISLRKFRKSKIIAASFALAAAASTIIATCILAVMYISMRNKINNAKTSISASLGVTLYSLAYASIATSILAFLFCLVSVFKTPRKSSLQEETQPFLANIPLVGMSSREAKPPENEAPYHDQNAYAAHQGSYSQLDQHPQVQYPQTHYDPLR